MYKSMSGISPTFDDSAFKTTIVKPYFDESVSHLKTSYRTKNGIIRIEYKILDGKVNYHIEGDKRISFIFDFNNQVLSKKEIDKNNFEFVLKL